MSFYEKFVHLCNQIGKSPSAVAKELDFSKSTVTKWKGGGGKTDATTQKLANYFNVPLDYFNSEEERELNKEQSELDLKITNDLELRNAIEKYYALDEQKQKHIIELINLLSEV